jgi:hypothetical protein
VANGGVGIGAVDAVEVGVAIDIVAAAAAVGRPVVAVSLV